MLKDRSRLQQERQQIRRRRRQSAWITFDGEATDRECWVADVSQGGAKITGVAAEVGSQFDITLVPHAPKRRCEVVWRHGRTLGIKFLG
ncbi:PilZ domain-containing protein [Bradyrhizobium sediminis]|uniref:PilZ domain-containing protein n=1 Tax=Bradyrhizobium sediminis TaxID=2840469 RepID=A0A975RQ58_9BRAD|nr:PilZ domain-containing protein [Bradyrhizobium sediminis]